MRKAREENDVLVASIFVNPTQFIAGEDFDKYPRTFERDTDLLKSCGVVRTYWINTRNTLSFIPVEFF